MPSKYKRDYIYFSSLGFAKNCCERIGTNKKGNE